MSSATIVDDGPRVRRRPRNDDIADLLDRVSDLLEVQDANPYRVRAYRNAARTVRETAQSIAELATTGWPEDLESLPGIGTSIASAIREVVSTGGLGMLARLEGQVSPEDLFTTVPGLGEELARRIHTRLGIETLEELELAAHDGRLEALPGFGRRRTHGLRDTLTGMLGRSTRRRARWIWGGPLVEEPETERPGVGLLLEVDEQYRSRADAGELRTIAPRRFNPLGEAWLPILHTELDGWSFTALYSNTARAHELGTTRDWVILYFERDGYEARCTVVTERRGPLAGRRVVRGREAECSTWYDRRGSRKQEKSS